MKVECGLDDVFEVTTHKLQQGLLLTTVGSDGGYNVMTIGWGLVGRLWREPVFMVAVRPSRHTFQLVEETNVFTVNVPSDGMDATIDFCGTVSGRDHDKIAERGLTALAGRRVRSPILEGCIAHFECSVIGKSRLNPELLSSNVHKTCYASGDYHTLYFGRILSILKDA